MNLSEPDPPTNAGTPPAEPGTAAELIGILYEELRSLARARMAREAPGQTLQATALVHEAYLRLASPGTPRWANRAHFFAAAAEAMRRILIDRARRRQAVRHGGGLERVDATDLAGELAVAAPGDDDELLGIHEALDQLARHDPDKADLVKLKYFAGLTFEQIAEVRECSVPTVKRHWAYARAWLFRELTRNGDGSNSSNSTSRATETQPRGSIPGMAAVLALLLPLVLWAACLTAQAAEPPAGGFGPDPLRVLAQGSAPAGFPSTWGMRDGRPVTADYEVDPEITSHPAYREAFAAGFAALPSLWLEIETADLFDPARGLYSNPLETGSDWERPATIEWVEPGAHGRVRSPAGLRIQGGWNRRPEESPKHSFRLVFRKRYGAGKLTFPLFGPDGPAEFDELILRAGCNNTWLHWDAAERRRGEFLRDPWMRATHAAMGHPAARGRFVHLFLRGLYWGVYNIVERPAGPFVAARFGGNPDTYDVRNASNLLEGDDTAWRTLLRLAEDGPEDPERYAQINDLLDVPAFADYLLLNHYGANGDWDGASNWYAARRRTPPGRFVFFVWDGERTLENPGDNTLAQDAADSPTRLFQRLRRNPEFRKVFAERARRHLTGNGALTPGPAAARYQALATEIDLAVVAESARWGDYRRDAHPYKTGPYELYTRDDHWRPEVRRLLTDYFPRRTGVYIRQLREAGLWAEEKTNRAAVGKRPTHDVFRSTDGARTWTRSDSGLAPGTRINAFAAGTTRLFAGLYSKGLYRLDPDQRTWVRTGSVAPLVLGASQGTLVGGQNPGGILWSEDLGQTWNEATGDLPLQVPVWAMTGGRNLLLAGAADGIFLSDDRGRSWSRSEVGLPRVCSGIAFLQRDSLLLAAAVVKD